MRILAVNLGNSSVLAALFQGKRRAGLLRLPVSEAFGPQGKLEAALKTLCARPVDQVVFCSVVPSQTKTLEKGLRSATGKTALRLHPEAAHGLSIDYYAPRRLGADRLAGALGAQSLYPGQNVIVVDCGTATTLTALDAKNTLRGGAIFPGMTLWARALASGTAQLPQIELTKPKRALGRSPEEAIASGLFHGHLGALKETIQVIGKESFKGKPHLVLGTGGHACFFAREKLFTRLVPDLILVGLRHFALKNSHA